MFREFGLAAALMVVGATGALAQDAARTGAKSPAAPTATNLTAPAVRPGSTVVTAARSGAKPVDALWYQRFTLGGANEPTKPMGNIRSDDDRAPRVAFDWSLNAGRWGVTLDVADNARWSPLIDPSAKDRVAAGAYFNMTPRVRVGGEMSLESRDSKAALKGAVPVEPGVKVESAFKF